MPTLRTCSSLIESHNAVSFLLRHGIPAITIADPIAAILNDRARHHIAVDDADVERATELLAELDLQPRLRQADWEMQSIPDLSRLDPALAPKCPHCGHGLPLLAPECPCPGCAATVDIVALLLDRHGPEVLTPCYPDDDTAAEDMTDSNLECPACRYSLSGLPNTGLCPECGETYDKHEIIRQRAGL